MINKERLVENYISLTQIEGVSKKERLVMEEVKNRLTALHVPFEEDDVGSKISGECGNLIVRVPPNSCDAEPFLFSAHVDTILSSQCTPVIRDGVIYSDGVKILGADDRAGVAVILEAIESAKESNTAHPEIEIAFLVAEEIGILGSKHLDYSLLASKKGFVIDSSADLGKIVFQAPTHLSFTSIIKGKAAHAAVAPEQGIHAIKIASDAISKIEVGKVTPDTIVSIGVIKGGTKTNVVPDHVEIKGEVRCLDKDDIPRYKSSVEETFKQSAADFGGKFSIEWNEEYAGFNLGDDRQLIEWVESAMRNASIEPELIQFLGGSDANNFNNNGIRTFNLGLGYKRNHSPEEYMSIRDLTGIAEVCFELIKLSSEA